MGMGKDHTLHALVDGKVVLLRKQTTDLLYQNQTHNLSVIKNLETSAFSLRFFYVIHQKISLSLP